METTSTKQKIIELAGELCQQRGFNAFSYHDLAKKLGIKTASIHYHFSTKADLGGKLIEAYHSKFLSMIKQLELTTESPIKRLAGLVDCIAAIGHEQRLCMCAMLTSDYATLPESMQSAIGSFFLDLEKWVAIQLQQGKENKEFNFNGTAQARAQVFVATLHGVLLSTRATRESKRMQNLKSIIIEDLQ